MKLCKFCIFNSKQRSYTDTYLCIHDKLSMLNFLPRHSSPTPCDHSSPTFCNEWSRKFTNVLLLPEKWVTIHPSKVRDSAGNYGNKSMDGGPEIFGVVTEWGKPFTYSAPTIVKVRICKENKFLQIFEITYFSYSNTWCRIWRVGNNLKLFKQFIKSIWIHLL